GLQRALQHLPRLRRVDLPEAVVGAADRGLSAVLKQLVHPGGDPAVPDHAIGVVVDYRDERVRFLARVAEHADDLVLVAPLVRVDIALGGRDRAEVVGPAGGLDPAVHELDGRALGRDSLPWRAQAGYARQQCQGSRGTLPGGVFD